ncbi:MAG: CotH kinase family protein, partial [Oscillospiraceae bacterium]|nr:CotH kinase family protein [Oscillospiraceae bacterium]
MKMRTKISALLILAGLFLGLVGEAPNSITASRAEVAAASAPQSAPLRVIFSHESGFFGESFQLSLGASRDNTTIFYTLNGEPTSQCPRDWQVFKGGVTPASNIVYTTPLLIEAGVSVRVTSVRAFAVRGSEISPVVTHNFVTGLSIDSRFCEDTLIFVLNGDPHGLFSHNDGVMVEGVDRQDWIDDFTRRMGRPPRPGPDWEMFPGGRGEINPDRPANFNRRGRESEREVHMEVFLPCGTSVISQRAGMRIKGGYSRAHEQKSIELYAREEDYGVHRFDFPFFGDERLPDGNIMNSYRRVRLRNGGSDRYEGFIRDEVAQNLLRQAGINDTQNHTPAAIFLNGNYYGVSWLKTPRTENHLRRKYGGETERFRTLGGSESGYGNEWWEGEPDAVSDWRALFRMAQGGLTDETRWADFSSRVCIENLMLYYAFNVYIQNLDWPNHNMEMWRYFPTDAERDDPDLHPHLRDGKWRWMPHDLEASFNIYNGSLASINTIHNVLRGGGGAANPQWQGSSAILNSVLQRPEMRGRFANTLSDLRDGVMTPQNATATLDRHISRIHNEHVYAANANIFMPNSPGWPNLDTFDTSRVQMRAFMQDRPAHMLNFIGQPFGAATNSGLDFPAGTRHAVNFTTSRGGSAVMNARIVHESTSVTGNYYGGTQIAITAKPYPGYVVSHWIVDGTQIAPTADGVMRLAIGSSRNVQLHFAECPTANLQITMVKAAGGDFLELHNPTTRSISGRGLYLTDSNDPHKWRLPPVIVRPGQTLFVPMSDNTRSADHARTHKGVRTNFNLSFRETLRLCDSRGNTLQTVEVTHMVREQVQTRSRTGDWSVIRDPRLPPPEPPRAVAPVRLVGRDTVTWQHYFGPVVQISENGAYTATLALNTPATDQLVSLALMSEGATLNWPDGFVGVSPAPAQFADARVSVTSISINGVQYPINF